VLRSWPGMTEFVGSSPVVVKYIPRIHDKSCFIQNIISKPIIASAL